MYSICLDLSSRFSLVAGWNLGVDLPVGRLRGFAGADVSGFVRETGAIAFALALLASIISCALLLVGLLTTSSAAGSLLCVSPLVGLFVTPSNCSSKMVLSSSGSLVDGASGVAGFCV